MMRLLTANQMRALDRATIEGGHVPGLELMERAGGGVARAMERRYGPLLGLRVLVLCGTGNNGGDGCVAARHLRAQGAELHVGLLGDPRRVEGDARAQLERLAAEGVRVEPVDSEGTLSTFIASRDQWDFALDALLGTGARGAPEGLMAAGVEALRELDERGTRVVAVDLPTGLDADTGEIARRTVRADLTVTFGAPKRGHYLYPGRAFVGALEVVDIGLVSDLAAGAEAEVELATEAEMAARLPQRDPRAHKGSVGRVLVVGGSTGLTGAVTLAARAATRAGAGYVQVAVPASFNDVLEIKLTEEMTLPLAETAERSLSRAALEPLLEHAGRVDAVVLGSGLGRSAETFELARRLVAEIPRPMVIDADALNALARHTRDLRGAPGPRVLTPHLGEMSRMSGIDAGALEPRRIEAAREQAQALGAVVVLKGAPTVTASPGGGATVNPTGNPGLATAGTGDVLAGIIGALLAQRLDPYDAARLGVFVHGLAADRATETLGQHGLAAGDVIHALPGTLLRLARLRDDWLGRRAGLQDRRPTP